MRPKFLLNTSSSFLDRFTWIRGLLLFDSSKRAHFLTFFKPLVIYTTTAQQTLSYIFDPYLFIKCGSVFRPHQDCPMCSVFSGAFHLQNALSNGSQSPSGLNVNMFPFWCSVRPIQTLIFFVTLNIINII